MLTMYTTPMMRHCGTWISIAGIFTVAMFAGYVLAFSNFFAIQYDKADAAADATTTEPSVPARPTLDTALYDKRLLLLAHRSATSTFSSASNAASTSTATSTVHYLWPVKTVYPLAGALLPFHRI